MRNLLIILTSLSMISCKEKTHTILPHSAKQGELNPLEPALLALAQTQIDAGQPLRAIPYLRASFTHNPSEEILEIFNQLIANTKFRIPTLELKHSEPILRFLPNGADSVFVALGGKKPTVIRWKIDSDPTPAAILFPTEAKEISHLSLSKNSRFILIQRDAAHLLCNADTLKPITPLGTFPKQLNPDTCLPFSENSLLLATPSMDINGAINWSIRDAASGEILRTEQVAMLPQIQSAYFRDTTLIIHRFDQSTVEIPLLGKKKISFQISQNLNSKLPIREFQISDPYTLQLTEHINIKDKKYADFSSEMWDALSGFQLDSATLSLKPVSNVKRAAQLKTLLPSHIFQIASSNQIIQERLAAATPDDYPELTASARAHAEIINKTFASGDSDSILTIIDTASHGLPLSTALFAAIESENSSYIQRAIRKASDAPKALIQLAKNHVSPLTDFRALRKTEDWLGYEYPDFTPLLNKLRDKQKKIISSIQLSTEPTDSEIESLIVLFQDPKTLQTLGVQTLSEHVLAAASVLAQQINRTKQAIQLADIAYQQGIQQAAALRVRAKAFTTLGDYATAHAIWLHLITDHPQSNHSASDYTEAAYTAFEVGDARQAMEILRTGQFRFPNDANAAIRSGWISLLTHHTEAAHYYLKHASQLGIPAKEIENTTALLAITYEQLGDLSTATAYHQQLLAISQNWNDPAQIAKLEWPEDFENSLLDIIRSQQENEPEPPRENDPINTAPFPEEYPSLEPPLPSR